MMSHIAVPPDPAQLAAIAATFGQVPRYTSYPTAPQFQAVADDQNWRHWLAELPAQARYALYIHVPFCRTMCWYCGCHTQVTKGDDALQRYLETLLREIELVARQAPTRPRVGGLHFGGGTPTILGGDRLLQIAAQLKQYFEFETDAEIAIEIDPRRFSADLLPALTALGVNRVSLGMQSLDSHVQVAINREQTYAMAAQTVSDLRQAGITAINLDLLYGLPYQTVDSIVDTVSRSLQLKPDRIALFGYAHVPWMKPHQSRIEAAALPDAAARFAQEAAAAATITAAGYRRIGLDHFAKADDPLAQKAAAGDLHRNFQGYTTEAGDVLLGFGPSAISTLPQGYAQNKASVVDWRRAMQSRTLPVARMRAVGVDDRLRRAVIEALMCHLGVNLARLAIRHGLAPSVFEADLEQLEPLIERGLVQRNGYNLTIPEPSRPLVRQVCAAFDRYLPRNPSPAKPSTVW
jgi:oxygen-independent coproporphyrinogen-3 oxidase